MPVDAQIQIQAQSSAILSARISPWESVALVDFPLHMNAGDSLIWAGERQYLRNLDIDVRYVTTVGRYHPDRLRRLHPEGPILLHGGGNFGDRWALFQRFRERVIADFPDRPIVQLPQSIEMSDDSAVHVRTAYSRHPDLTVLLRDTRSMDVAQQLLPEVRVQFCPDLAFGYTPGRSKAPQIDVVELRRTDNESTGEGALLEPHHSLSVVTADWELSAPQHLRWQLAKAPGSLARRARTLGDATYPFAEGPSYDRVAGILLSAAERTVLQGRVVVTDRLHAAVLALLHGRAVIMRDNVTGKLSSIYSDYLHRFDGVRFARSAGHATELALDVLSSAAD